MSEVFARKLERERARKPKRERDEARQKLDICMAANSDVARIARERDEAREQNAKLRDIAERAIDCVTCNDDLIWLMEELKQLKECVITPKETHEVYLWKDGQYVKEGKK
jgi:hypothetical protein